AHTRARVLVNASGKLVIVQPSLCLVIVKTDRFKRIGINTDDHVAAVTPVGHPQDSADDSGKKQGVCSVPSPLELDAVGLVASGKQALDFLFRQSATPKPVACSVFQNYPPARWWTSIPSPRISRSRCLRTGEILPKFRINSTIHAIYWTMGNVQDQRG